MSNVHIKKLRKIFAHIQMYCSLGKEEANKQSYMKNGIKRNSDTKLTDYERGRIAGMHRAYNDISKKINSMIQFADSVWNGCKCRDEDNQEIRYNTVTVQIKHGPKFNPGQGVCAVHVVFDSNAPDVHVKCDVCDSTGKIKIVGKNGEYTCPVCHGKIEENKNPYKYEIAYKYATIGFVRHEEYSSKYKGRGKKFDTISKYLLEETGVECGGQVWPEHVLFADEKEAQEFCDKYVPSDKFITSKPILKTEAGIEVK